MEDFRWIRQIWHGPIVVKGVLTSEDARRAVGSRAVAVVVSNHGGRQLDGAPASLDVLPEVVNAVGSRVEVLMDGGIRRGSDVVKAICLEPVRSLLDAPTRMVLPPRGPPVLHERWKYCGRLEANAAASRLPVSCGLDRSYLNIRRE